MYNFYGEHQYLDVLLIFVVFLLGSVPFGYIFTRIFIGKDIRSLGSSNVGATNVTRNAGKLAGVLTLLCDMLKGFLAVVIASLYVYYVKSDGSSVDAGDPQQLPSSQIFQFMGNISHIMVLFACFFVLLGHFYPPWLKFKGGKGVATFFGLLLGLNLHLFLFASLCWLIVFAIFKISSLAAIITMLLTALFCIIFSRVFDPGGNSTNLAYAITIFAIMIIAKHHSNIKNLLAGQEK